MTGEPSHPAHADFALEKLTSVLGGDRAQRIYLETLARSRLTDIRTADDLYAFGQQLSTRGGFEAAVGEMLSVAAILRGAIGNLG